MTTSTPSPFHFTLKYTLKGPRSTRDVIAARNEVALLGRPLVPSLVLQWVTSLHAPWEPRSPSLLPAASLPWSVCPLEAPGHPRYHTCHSSSPLVTRLPARLPVSQPLPHPPVTPEFLCGVGRTEGDGPGGRDCSLAVGARRLCYWPHSSDFQAH